MRKEDICWNAKKRAISINMATGNIVPDGPIAEPVNAPTGRMAIRFQLD